MEIIRNDKMINRNGKIGQYLSLAGFACMAVVIVLMFQLTGTSATQTVGDNRFYWFFAAFILGMIFTQIGNSLGSRFGRSPRIDQRIDAALKGLPGEYNLYHYKSPASHLLVGPAGVWVLLPYHVVGTITYDKKRWKVRGGGFLQSYIRFFGAESIGRPDLDAEAEVAAVNKTLLTHYEQDELPAVKPLILFVSDKAVIEIEDAPIPSLPIKKLKDFIRQTAKDAPMDKAVYEQVKELLPKE
jgi:hypothetical protein